MCLFSLFYSCLESVTQFGYLAYYQTNVNSEPNFALIHPSDGRVLNLLLYFLKSLDPPIKTFNSTENFSQYSACKAAMSSACSINCFEVLFKSVICIFLLP